MCFDQVMVRPIPALIALLWLGGMAVAVAAQTGDLPAAFALPKAAKEALNNAFDHWQAVGVDPQAPCAGKTAPASAVQGDFNSDGQTDVALTIKTDKGVRLVAVLQRTGGSIVVDIDGLGTGAAEGAPAIGERGSSFANPESRLKDVYSADTLLVTRCAGPSSAYLWTGLGFRRVDLK